MLLCPVRPALGKHGTRDLRHGAPAGRITAVEVSRTRQDLKRARLQAVLSVRSGFRLDWHWDGKPAVLQSRAIDETGYVQPTRAQLIDARGPRSFYHYNGIQSWNIDAKGEVTNVHA